MAKQLITIFEIMKNCGHCEDVDMVYTCSHPENTEEPGRCFTWACPVAYEATYEDMLELDPDLAEEYREEQERNGFIESDWMVVEGVSGE